MRAVDVDVQALGERPVFLVAAEKALGPCRSPSRLCVFMGDYLAEKIIGNIFEHEDEVELSAHLRSNEYRAALKGIAVNQLLLLWRIYRYPSRYIIVRWYSSASGLELTLYRPLNYKEYIRYDKRYDEMSPREEYAVGIEPYCSSRLPGVKRSDIHLPIPRKTLMPVRNTDAVNMLLTIHCRCIGLHA